MPRTIKETKLMYPDELLKYLRANDIDHKEYTIEKGSTISKHYDNLFLVGVKETDQFKVEVEVPITLDTLITKSIAYTELDESEVFEEHTIREIIESGLFEGDILTIHLIDADLNHILVWRKGEIL